MCEALRLQHGFDAISPMPTNLYGPGDNYHPSESHVVPALIRRFYEAKQKAQTQLDVGAPEHHLENFYMPMISGKLAYLLSRTVSTKRQLTQR